ncbi:molybdate ABC transporter permease subunit [Novosphingobium guangzhouense]|uniref:Molybdenum transport system permease n=1 Tax=Novosphingobium guangzhouense TaxID=1850347 RepID=A0A2K2G443_9SPHN|nr:molybdate ABC transporter permease subunit [Novosphingobium guangzhouense]PNU05758.1 molybdate ABC transporter permease [Novosphingobium guangzhouense]
MQPLSPAEWEVLVLSLKVGGVAIVATLPVAFGLAWMLARWRFPGKVLIDAVVHLPLVLPPVVTGWLLLLAFSPNAPFGAFLERTLGLTFLFRWTGAALAAGVMALPLMVRAMRLSLEGVDRRLESAARTLGAGPWRTFIRVTLPLSANGVLAALVLGFARSVGEFGATITFASNIPGETQTLPLAIYSALQIPGSDSQVVRLAGLSVLLSVAALVLSEWLIRRSGQQRGRHVI